RPPPPERLVRRPDTWRTGQEGQLVCGTGVLLIGSRNAPQPLGSWGKGGGRRGGPGTAGGRVRRDRGVRLRRGPGRTWAVTPWPAGEGGWPGRMMRAARSGPVHGP